MSTSKGRATYFVCMRGQRLPIKHHTQCPLQHHRIPPLAIIMDGANAYAECAKGNHDAKRSFGTCGVVAAILLFPFGLICCFMDSEKKCTRCGVVLAK
ncbi:hypothetical protein CPC08DRAFT_453940 [Agrocybe pediades]|nr:hypothetical protein CPC08DRAFT_453940 [Agrocybe pediades]